MDERRIARIREMETALNEWVDLGNKGEELLEEMTAHLPALSVSSPTTAPLTGCVTTMPAMRGSSHQIFPTASSREDAVFDLLTQLYGLCGIVERHRAAPRKDTLEKS